MASRGKSARNKGNSFEREIMAFFKSLGFDKCKTSRNESKTRDDLKIDLCFTEPFNVQCKAHESIKPSVHEILFKEMPNENNYNLLFWKRNGKGTIVAMSLDDFECIFNVFIRERVGI